MPVWIYCLMMLWFYYLFCVKCTVLLNFSWFIFHCIVCVCHTCHIWFDLMWNTISNDITMCRPDGDGTVCSGHGQCSCGQCICDPISPIETNKRYTGDLCECNDYTCEYFNEQMCGGIYIYIYIYIYISYSKNHKGHITYSILTPNVHLQPFLR